MNKSRIRNFIDFKKKKVQYLTVLRKFGLFVDFDAYDPLVEIEKEVLGDTYTVDIEKGLEYWNYKKIIDYIPITQLKLNSKYIDICKALLLRGIHLRYYNNGIYLSPNNNMSVDVRHVKALLKGLELGHLEKDDTGLRILIEREAEERELDYIVNCIAPDYFGEGLYIPCIESIGFDVPAFSIDPCISKVVRNLNNAGFSTHTSCEGHGERAYIGFYRDFGRYFSEMWERIPYYVKNGWVLLPRNSTWYLVFTGMRSKIGLFNQSFVFGEYIYTKSNHMRWFSEFCKKEDRAKRMKTNLKGKIEGEEE